MAESAPLVQVAPVIRAGAGTDLTVEVQVTNTSSAARTVTVAALGLDPGWLPPPATTPLLAPGRSAVVTLRLRPSAGTLPASYPFAVTAQSLDPAGAATGSPGMAESVLVVNPRAQLTLRLARPSVTAIVSARLGVLLRNSGSAPARVRLAAQSGQGLRVTLPEHDVEVPVGGEVRVTGRVRVARPRVVRSPTEHQFRVSALGAEAAPYADGSVTVRGVLAPFWLKLVVLLAVVSVWVGAALVVIPAVGRHFGDDTTATMVGGSRSGGDSPDGGGGGTDGGTDDSGGTSGDGGDAGGGGGAGGKSGAKAQTAAKKNPDIQLNGTVTADDPTGVNVSLAPTSLVDEEAIGGIGVGVGLGVDTVALTSAGKRSVTMTLLREPGRTPSPRGAVTGTDGAWSFPSVTAPGYYLLTFSKPGYQTKKYVVDSSAAVAQKPLAVRLEPGDGSLSGHITGPDGKPVGGAKVVIGDGTGSITASSNTKGDIGAWSVTGLSTPATYVVQASYDGLSMEAAAVDLPAGGRRTVDLRLRHGVATLTGLVRAPTSTGEVTGAGGVTVTVKGADGSEGLVRTASTLTRSGQVGRYILPALPAPGDYVVAISGDGYLTRTSRLTLTKGQSRATLDATLASASGVVHGTVTDVASHAGLTDVGVVLADAEHTYKTMTTSEQPGVFRINGVAPGTYTLSSQLFGYAGHQLTVTVEPGQDVRVDPTIASMPGGALPAGSTIVGAVADGTTNLEVTCPAGGRDDCVHAVVVEPKDAYGQAADRSFVDDFLPSETYELPGSGDGLRPGLHQVVLSAPGYEQTAVNVEVPANAKVTAPTAQMMPAPRFRGNVQSKYATQTETCLWAVQNGYPEAADGGYTAALPDCQQAINDHVCPSNDTDGDNNGTYDLTTLTPQAVCSVVSATDNTYEITVPKHGTYTFVVKPSDTEFFGPPETRYTLKSGDVLPLDVPLHRYGQVQVQVQEPGDNGVLVPSVKATITVEQVPGGPVPPTVPAGDPPVETDVRGIATLKGFATGNYKLVATSADGDIEASTTVYISEDNVTGATIQLTNQIDAIVGQVVWIDGGTAVPVDDATVRGVFPAYYVLGNYPISVPYEVHTQDGGCFAFASAEDTVPTPPASDCGTTAFTSAAPDNTVAVGPVLSNIASSFEVTKTGFAPWSSPNYRLTPWVDDEVNQIVLKPLPITFGASMEATPDTIDWSSVSFAVTAKNASSTRFSMSAGAGGVLSFSDSNLDTPGTILPGTYRVTPSAPGFTSTEGVLDCEVASTCTWTTEPTLTGLGSIRGSLVGVLAARPASGDATGLPADELSGVTVHARECTTSACTAVKSGAADNTGVTDGNGDFSISGTTRSGDTRALKPGWYKLSATVAGFNQVGIWKIEVVSGKDADTGSYPLWIQLAKVTVTIKDDSGSTITTPKLELLSGTDPVQEKTGAPYVFSDVLPGSYTLRVTGTGLREQSQQITVVRADADQSFTMPISVGAVATGRVTETVDEAPVAVAGARVSLHATSKVHTASDCATAAVLTSAGGVALTTTTDASGNYTIRNVPDGTWAMCFSATGYATAIIASTAFDHAAPIPTLGMLLTRVTHPVTLTVTASDPTAALGSATVKLTKGATVFSDIGLTAGTTAGTWVASFTQVPFGCWVPSLTLADHYGSLSAITPAGSCTSGLEVPQVDTSTPVAATAKLAEARLDATATTTYAAPHTALPSGSVVKVHVAVADTTIAYDGPGAVLWLPIGSHWTATSALDPADATFWPGRSDSGDLTKDGDDADLDLTEQTRAVSVTVPTAGAGITVTATDVGNAALTLTADTNASGVALLHLPAGTWNLTATVLGDAAADPPTTDTDYRRESYLVDGTAAADVRLQKVDPTVP